MRPVTAECSRRSTAFLAIIEAERNAAAAPQPLPRTQDGAPHERAARRPLFPVLPPPLRLLRRGRRHRQGGRLRTLRRRARARAARGRARGARAHRDVGALLRGLARAHAAQSPRARHGRAAERVRGGAGCRRGPASDVRGAELRRARALSQSGHHVPRAGTGDVRRRAARRAGALLPHEQLHRRAAAADVLLVGRPGHEPAVRPARPEPRQPVHLHRQRRRLRRARDRARPAAAAARKRAARALRRAPRALRRVAAQGLAHRRRAAGPACGRRRAARRRRLHPRDAAPVQRGRHAAGEPAGALRRR